MTDPDRTQTILRELADRAEIGDLMAAYSLHAAGGEGAKMAALFTSDGSFEAGNARAVGREALDDFYGRTMVPHKSIPIVANLLVAIDGDEATAASLMATTHFAGDPGGFCGRYDDRLRREDGRWKFVSRRFTFYQGRPEGI